MERDKKIIQLYKDGQTLHELGKKFNLSRERVGQIVRKTGFSLSSTEKRDRIRTGINSWRSDRHGD